LLYWI